MSQIQIGVEGNMVSYYSKHMIRMRFRKSPEYAKELVGVCIEYVYVMA